MLFPEACFSLLGLEPAFDLDEKALEAAYFSQQRAFHPDRFAGKPQAERAAALQRSVDINRAYTALKDPLRRAQTLLAMRGIKVGGEGDSVKPQMDILTENMQWRETIDETPPSGAAALCESLSEHVSRCLERISALYGAGNDAAMAQETLRLGYLLKAREAATAKQRLNT